MEDLSKYLELNARIVNLEDRVSRIENSVIYSYLYSPVNLEDRIAKLEKLLDSNGKS